MGDNILAAVEEFLLPARSNALTSTSSVKSINSTLPLDRLERILYDVAVADHIRSLQAIYRDLHDEMALGSEFYDRKTVKIDEKTSAADFAVTRNISTMDGKENGEKNERIANKYLVDKITEGRARILTLTKLCYGDESIEHLKALVDLASAYAQQGMWTQVHSHVALATQKGAAVVHSQTHNNAYETFSRKADKAVLLVHATFKQLRAHCTRHLGQANKDFIAELVAELTPICNNFADNENDGIHANTDDHRPLQESLEEYTRIATSLNTFFSRYEGRKSPSWGAVVDFLRTDCDVMSGWIELMSKRILPQTKALLLMAFRQADQQERGVTHPAQLGNLLIFYPSVSKVIASTNIAKLLSQLKIEIPLIIDQFTGEVIDEKKAGSLKQSNISSPQHVSYELPISWEEFLSLFVIALTQNKENDIIYNPIDLLRANILTLLGVCQIFTAKLQLAEGTLTKALKQMEYLGLELDAPACDLYNSIAQMMIMKYRNWQTESKNKIKNDSQVFINSDEGKMQVRKEMHILKEYIKQKSNASLGSAELENKARSNILKAFVKSFTKGEESEEAKKAVEAANRYLVKSYEILETIHGPTHPSVGGACLAVASVLNIIEQFEDSREWLVRALRKMEKVAPLPERAIAFIKVQLSQILLKLGHTEEAVRVLSSASAFHTTKVMSSLESLSEQKATVGSQMINVVPALELSPGRLLYEDIKLAMALNSRLVKMHSSSPQSNWQAAELASNNAALVERAFGWDSPEALAARRDAGDMLRTLGDWEKAAYNYKKSMDCCEVLYGKNDKRSQECIKLYQLSITKKKEMFDDAMNDNQLELNNSDNLLGI